MARKQTTVSQTYTPSLNVSITREDDKVVLITMWTTGDDSTKTKREGQTSAERNGWPSK